MSVSSAGSRRVPEPSSVLWPILGTVGLGLAVFLAPFPMASALAGGGYPSRSALVDALNSAFVHHWDAGSGVVGADLARPVDFWARFHLVKAVLAAILLVVLAALGSRTWTLYALATTSVRRLVGGATTGLTALLALFTLLILVANTQGAIAPLSSALGLLPIGGPDAALAATLAQVRSDLAGGGSSPVVEALVRDFTVYHQAMAGLGAAVIAGLLAAAVLLWRGAWKSAARHHRQLLMVAVVAALVSAAFFGVVTAANLSTVADPAPALLAFVEGGR